MGRRDASVLSIRSFRRLWIATSLSSLGDWLSLLALSALAYSLTGRHVQATAGAIAVSGVWITSLLPYLLFGPLAGAVADRFDRRINLVVGDVFRAVLYLSIPLNLVVGFANRLTWLYVAQFLASLRVPVLGPSQGRVYTEPRAAGEAGPGESVQPADDIRHSTTRVADLHRLRFH